MIGKKPKISVIVPVYNLTRYLENALESVRAQTLQDFEVIVVDDGSRQSGEIRDIAEKFHFERLKFFRHPVNRGLSAARNTGLMNAEGEYIAFLDSDDLLLPQKFEIQSGMLDRDPECAMIYSDEFHLEGGQSQWKPIPIQFGPGGSGPSGWILDDFLKRSFIAVMTVMTRASLLKELGGFEQTLPYNEDDIMWYRIMIKQPVLFSDYVSGVRRLHDTNMSADREKMTRFQLRSFHRLKALYPQEISARRDIIRTRVRSILKSYIKYCFFEGHLPKPSLLRDFLTVIKALLLVIQNDLMLGETLCSSGLLRMSGMQ